MEEGRDVTAKELKAEQATNRLEGWRRKVMHGQHVRQIEEFAGPESWQWLRRGSLKRETESLLAAAQDEAFRNGAKKKNTVLLEQATHWDIRNKENSNLTG